MKELETWKGFVGYHKYCFEGEFASADLKVVLQGISQQLSNQKAEVPILSCPEEIGDADSSLYFL